MRDESPIRILLIVVSVVQIAISLFYVKQAKAGATIVHRREEKLVLTAATGTGRVLGGMLGCMKIAWKWTARCR